MIRDMNMMVNYDFRRSWVFDMLCIFVDGEESNKF